MSPRVDNGGVDQLVKEGRVGGLTARLRGVLAKSPRVVAPRLSCVESGYS